MPAADWNHYLRAPVGHDSYQRVARYYDGALEALRQTIARLLQTHRPARLACLGAGYLFDLALAELVRYGEEIYLVDWIPGISAQGFRGSLISYQDRHPSCVLCKLEHPQRFCGAFSGRVAEQEVCATFIPDGKRSGECARYCPGPQPIFLQQDITSGRAERFAQQCLHCIVDSAEPDQAFIKAEHCCDQLATNYAPLTIPEHSIDLATSSMVVSQFDNEPYSYFSLLLERRFGREQLLAQESQLMPLMERLRRKLFVLLCEGHIHEMWRILSTNGVAYINLELFRSEDERNYFLTHDMPLALEIIDRYFHFDFTGIEPSQALRPTRIGDGISIIDNLLLRPRQQPVKTGSAGA
ncbi:MAG: hypothetical protein HY940_01250 [Gammaproteobacteria bacterium]|nr:hypothetical protein [Gammaproteobacteria bacterium]